MKVKFFYPRCGHSEVLDCKSSGPSNITADKTSLCMKCFFRKNLQGVRQRPK